MAPLPIAGGGAPDWTDLNTLNKTFKLAFYPTDCASELYLKPDALGVKCSLLQLISRILRRRAHDWIVARAERQIDEQSNLAKAQDARAVMMLTTAVVLSTLSALIAAIAIAVPRDTISVSVASLSGLAGFSLASTLVLFSVRSPELQHFWRAALPGCGGMSCDRSRSGTCVNLMC